MHGMASDFQEGDHRNREIRYFEYLIVKIDINFQAIKIKFLKWCAKPKKGNILHLLKTQVVIMVADPIVVQLGLSDYQTILTILFHFRGKRLSDLLQMKQNSELKNLALFFDSKLVKDL